MTLLVTMLTASTAWADSNPTVELEDHNEDNLSIISANDGKTCNVVLRGRTLYKDGKWNTLCLPFDVDMTDPDGPLYGATFFTVTGASIEGTTLNLTFGKSWNGDPDKENTLTAGTPYIIKWDKAADYVDDDAHNIVNPVFTNVKPELVGDDFWEDDYSVGFLGIYDAMPDITIGLEYWLGEGYDVLLMGGDNTLRYGGSGASLGACRAFFLVNPTKVGNGSQAARLTSFSMDFGEGDGETTGIVSMDNGQWTLDKEAGAWYTLDGRQLAEKPTMRGIYVNNGRKVVIK